MKILKHNKTFLSIMTCMFLILCAVFITRQYVVKADSSTSDNSFANLAEAGADYLNNLYSGSELDLQGGAAYNDNPEPNRAGTAGGLLGYTNPKLSGKPDVKTNLISTNNEGNAAYQYDSLPGEQYKAYCYYGYALSQLGLDQTGANGIPDNVRRVVGILMLAVFILSQSINLFWSFILTILEYVNPFYLVKSALGAGADDPLNLVQSYSGYASNVVGPIKEGMNTLRTAFGDFYNTLQSMSMYTFLPIIIAVTLFIWLVVRKGRDGGKTFKNLIIRFVFACIGIPLLFSVYTTALSLVKDFTVTNISLGNVVVASNFLDFEGWVYKNRLSAKDLSDLKIRSDTHLVSAESQANVRQYCYNINKSLGKYIPSDQYVDSIPTIDATTGTGNYNSQMLDMLQTSAESGVSLQASYVRNVIRLLERYADGTKISVSGFESAYKQFIMQDGLGDMMSHLAGSGIDSSTVLSTKNSVFSVWCDLSSSWRSFSKSTATAYYVNKPGLEATLSIYQVNLLINNRFSDAKVNVTITSSVAGGTGEITNFWADGQLDTNSTSASSNTFSFTTPSSMYGLSGMAMYNYLSSDFDGSKVNVYSANDTASNYSKAEHYAVNAVGTGVMQIIFIIDSLLLLSIYVVVGYGYGIAILLGNFKAMFKMIPAVLTGVLGSMKGIASAIILTAAMIIEILGTCILYSLACQFVAVIYKMIESPVAYVINKALGATSLNDAGVIAFVAIGIVSIVLMVQLIKKLLDYRYAICQSVTEAATDIINRFLGTHVGTPGLGTPATSFGQHLGNAALLAGGTALALGTSEDARGSVRSLGESLGLTKSEEATGDREGSEGDSETSGLGDMSGAHTETMGLGVKHDNGTGERPGGEAKEASGGKYTGSNLGGKNINTENDAEAYVDENKEAFEAELNGRKSGSLVSGGVRTGENTYEINGKEYQMINAETGEPYTAQDKAQGKPYSLVNSKGNGQAYVDENGNAYANMDSNSMKTDRHGHVTGIETDDGTVISIADKKSSKMVANAAGADVAPTYKIDGEEYQMVNSRTGQPYTAQDKANGEPYSLVDSDGETYVDKSGKSYDNMDSDSVKTDRKGQISGIESEDGTTTYKRNKLVEETDNELQGGTGARSNVAGRDDSMTDDTMSRRQGARNNLAADSSSDSISANNTFVDENGDAVSGGAKSGRSRQYVSDIESEEDGTTAGLSAVNKTGNNMSAMSGRNASDTSTYEIDGEQYQMINPRTGEPYTAQDKAHGESYSLVDSNGNAYVDKNGTTYANMGANSVVTDASGQNVFGVVSPSGNVTAFTEAGAINAAGQGASGVISQNNNTSAFADTGAAGAAGAVMIGAAYQAASGYGVPVGGNANSNVYVQNGQNNQGGNTGNSNMTSPVVQNTQPSQSVQAAPNIQVNNQIGMMNTQSVGGSSGAGQTSSNNNTPVSVNAGGFVQSRETQVIAGPVQQGAIPAPPPPAGNINVGGPTYSGGHVSAPNVSVAAPSVSQPVIGAAPVGPVQQGTIPAPQSGPVYVNSPASSAPAQSASSGNINVGGPVYSGGHTSVPDINVTAPSGSQSVEVAQGSNVNNTYVQSGDNTTGSVYVAPVSDSAAQGGTTVINSQIGGSNTQNITSASAMPAAQAAETGEATVNLTQNISTSEYVNNTMSNNTSFQSEIPQVEDVAPNLSSDDGERSDNGLGSALKNTLSGVANAIAADRAAKRKEKERQKKDKK